MSGTDKAIEEWFKIPDEQNEFLAENIKKKKELLKPLECPRCGFPNSPEES